MGTHPSRVWILNLADVDNITYRRGTLEDSYSVFYLFEQTLADLLQNLGFHEPTSFSDPRELNAMWEQRRSLYEHLALHADQFWIAESAGKIVGFARSILEDGVCELTEFFVQPGLQSSGVGKQLLVLAFPLEGFRQRTIIATPDLRALARYLKTGVYPRFPVAYFGKSPEPLQSQTDLKFEKLLSSPGALSQLAVLDETILGFKRMLTQTWLLKNRQGYLYMRNNQPVGYGYQGTANGPFALLDAADFPAALAHAESQAFQRGADHFGVEVPLINRVAVDYLLSSGFRLEGFLAQFMADKPFGNFERYILTSPPFFL